MRETETLELKKSTSELKQAIKSIVAILNKHKKGELYFGIKNNGEVVGQYVTDKTIRDISKSISDNIEPKIFPKIHEVAYNDKICIRIEFSGNNVPYYAYGRTYIRVGDEDKQMSAKEVETFIIEKNKDKLSWDKNICEEANFNDISSEKLKNFLQEVNLKYETKESSLKKLGLLNKNKLLNVAVILFAKNPDEFFPNAKLRCAVFGKTTATTIDMTDFNGDLFTLIDKAEKYILEHINVGMKLDGLKRVDVPEIDKEAFREAIINAFCHRNYWKFDSVNIAVFSDRLEIRSPGLLYGNLTIKKIRNEMVSERRNELIADMFHKIHFVEKWGRGIGLILKKEPDTIFKEIGTQFITVFKRKHVNKVIEIDVLNERQKKTINYLNEKGKITRKEYEGLCNTSKRTAIRDLNDLLNKEIIIEKERGPSLYYILI